METITDNSLADWLYNRFVECARNDKQLNAIIYENFLEKIIDLLPPGRRYSLLKRRAKTHLKDIQKATKSGTVKKLHYTGAEFVADFKKVTHAYEVELRKDGFDEETINYLVLQKKKDMLTTYFHNLKNF